MNCVQLSQVTGRKRYLFIFFRLHSVSLSVTNNLRSQGHLYQWDKRWRSPTETKLKAESKRVQFWESALWLFVWRQTNNGCNAYSQHCTATNIAFDTNSSKRIVWIVKKFCRKEKGFLHDFQTKLMISVLKVYIYVVNWLHNIILVLLVFISKTLMSQWSAKLFLSQT